MKSVLTHQDLAAYIGAMGEDKSLPKIGGKRLRSVTMYKSGLSEDLAANNGSILVAGTKKEVGITNFEDGNRLPKGMSILVTSLRILHDTTAAVTPKTAIWANVAPPIWKNGEFTIRQEGQGVLFQASGTDVCNFKASTGNDADFREVVPFLLRPDADIDMVVSLAGIAAADQAYKVELRGVNLFLESNG